MRQGLCPAFGGGDVGLVEEIEPGGLRFGLGEQSGGAGQHLAPRRRRHNCAGSPVPAFRKQAADREL